MNLLAKYFLFLLFLISCINSAKAQNANLLAQFTGDSISGSYAYVTVQVKSTVPNEQLFASQLWVSFTGTTMSFPANNAVSGTDYIWGSNFDPNDTANHYDPSITHVSFLRKDSITIDSGTYLSINTYNTNPGYTAPNVNLPTSSWLTLVTLRFKILDKHGQTNFNFDTTAMEKNTQNPRTDNTDTLQEIVDQNFNNFLSGGMPSLGPLSLPVTLSSFAAMYSNGSTRLNWTTSSEINNAYFTVQRSQDGKHFEDLFNREGAGNSNHIINYVAYDAQPLPGISYYRLKQTDFNGASETFNMVSIYNPVLGEFAIQSVSPTNFTDNTTLYYKMPADANVQLMVTDMQGKLVADLLVPSMTGDNTYSLTNTESWSPGVYFVNMIYDGRQSHIKMVKN